METPNGLSTLVVNDKETSLYAAWDPSPIFLDGWMQFNRVKWGLEPCWRRYTLQGADLPALEVVLYLDRRGRVRRPSPDQYLPLRFLPAPGTESSPRRLTKQWLALSTEMAKELRVRGVVGGLVLPPGIIDGRAFKWTGLSVGIKYTYIGPLPHDSNKIGNDVKRKCKKARQLGYYVNPTTDWEGVARCLSDTERKQIFSYGLAVSDLASCSALLGPGNLVASAGFTPDGEMVCADLTLHVKGGIALGWAQGTRREHLSSGVTQLVNHFVIDWLTKDGATGLDWVGADIESFATAKAAWGFDLTPQIFLGGPSPIRSALAVAGAEVAAIRAVSLARRWLRSRSSPATLRDGQ